ncbi:fasciclin domain-containing protein [Rhizorhabdus sp.]|uniref:fasciclin domain-containing protein n=1 Tax=Rhizorhabdus sp. TaxID=1968843 RepID=UPI001B4B2A00|nr:fasciclin domain-containing protein [Rhizorhabdus sp.]MBP8236052.1 fasciclin domain-containing protein [Rhizorhabdus sp.]
MKITSEKLFRAIAGAALMASAAIPFAAAQAADHHGAHQGTVVDGAVASPDHTTLVAAVKAAGLVETLSGTGPFTVFAPTNAAFAKLPAGTVDTLLKPENKATLTSILTYHVVPGKLMAADIAANAAAHGGKAMLKTVQGETLTGWKDSAGGWWLTDAKGGKVKITAADMAKSNGVIHVIDGVLMP